MANNAAPLLQIGNHRFEWGSRTYVMGILNVSADSFAGDGVGDVAAAVARARRLAEQGADIIDIGGQSTRPGFDELSVDEELSRIIPALQAVVSAFDVPVSIDAYRAPVVAAALEAGASMVNDIWGFRHDPEVARLVAEANVPAVIMHNQRGRQFTDVIDDLRSGFAESLRIAEQAGINRNKLIIDPGFGFGWPIEANLDMLRRLSELKDLGLPILVGTSRKSTIGAVLDVEVPEQRLWGTAATIAIAIANGADIVRVHDVAEMKQVCRMADAIVRPRT